MTRNLKALGLALMAAFALSAALAAGAQAETHKPVKLTPTAYPAIITGEQISSAAHLEHQFKPEIGAISCKSVKFDGTIESAATNTSITILPTYSGCQTKVGASTFPFTLDMTHCGYLFTEGTKKTEHEYTNGQISLECVSESETPHLKAYNDEAHTSLRCEWTITQFVHKGNETFTNVTPETGKKYVKFTTKIEGLRIDKTFGTLAQCGLKEQNMTYTGETALKAYQDNGVHLLTQTPTTYNYTEGEQYDLTVSGGV